VIDFRNTCGGVLTKISTG